MVHPSLLFVLFMLHTTTPTVYYVTPEYNNDDANNTLSHYLGHSDEYFTSNSQLRFLPGEHILNANLILKNISNFTLIEINSSIIHCIPHVSVMVVNVTTFKFENMNLINCGKSQARFLYINFKQMIDNHINDEHIAAVLLYNCTSVIIKDTNLLVDAYSTGLLVVNTMNMTEITNVKVQINCNSTPSSYTQPLGRGILFYYNDRNITNNTFANVTFHNFHYKIHDLCLHYQQYVMKILLYQNQYSVSITIRDTLFSNLINTTALFCHMAAYEFNATNELFILNSIIHNNTGNSWVKMFDIMLHRSQCTYDSPFIGYTQKAQDLIIFKNCSFMNNTNMEAMIYITPKSSARIIGYLLIHLIKFTNNNATHFMKVKSVTEVSPWLLTTNISICQLNASLNEHHDGDSLISLTNGYISFEESVINENQYYESILQLHLSVSVCSGYNELNGNHARHILKAKRGSYFIAKNNAILNMSENTVYVVAKQIRTIADDAKPICPLQFWNSQSAYNDLDSLNIKIVMLNNVHMMSKNLQGEDLLLKNCVWLAGFAFYKINAKVVYQRILVIQNIVINKTTERSIPLSVCPCSTSNNMSCYSPNLGSLFPGQTLQINLIVRKQNKISGNQSTTLVASNTPDNDCSIKDSYQLSQTHLNSGCNNYTYTIWPSHKHITECLLFIGLIDTPEMFYVQIKPCPKGFTLQEHKRSCNCDPLLNNIIRSCNLDDQTVFRPAKSWISADTVNGSHTYHVSQLCPFDYCLLQSSHLDLDTPDMQCQFSRSGLLCGHCQQGLSTVFGSSQCKHCSNISVLIVLPIAIAGMVLVTMLFLFNITVTNGSINSFIFYVNMISINYSMFCHEKYSVYCTLLH